MVKILTFSGKGEQGDDGRLHLPLGNEQREVEGVAEDVVADEVGEEGDEVKERVSRLQRGPQIP